MVLVHGLWYGRASLWPLARALRRRGWACSLFGYSSVFRDPEDSAGRLADRVRELRREPTAPTLHFVGHSLGGLIILAMLRDLGATLPLGRTVLLGSPVNGNDVARRIGQLRLLRPLLGRAIEFLDPGVAMLPEGLEVGAIAGTSPMGAGRFVSRLSPPHDGTVTVAETRMDGLADHLELPVTHTGLVLSGEVADAVDRFLRLGRFAAGDLHP